MKLREAHKFLDDLQAAKADLESGSPALQAHAFGVMAAIMTELAERTDGVPGLRRFGDFMRENAAEMLAHKRGIETVDKEFNRLEKKWERQRRAEDRQREARAQMWRDAGQEDMFGS